MIMIESEGITENVRTWRTDVVARIADTLGLEHVMFEAADPEVFAGYVKNYGPEVNLFVDHSQIVQLECLRSGHLGDEEPVGASADLQGLRTAAGVGTRRHGYQDGPAEDRCDRAERAAADQRPPFRTRSPIAGGAGMVGWILHRLTGVGVVAFLLWHVVDTSLLGWGPGPTTAPFDLYRTIGFRVGEILLFWGCALPCPERAACHHDGFLAADESPAEEIVLRRGGDFRRVLYPRDRMDGQLDAKVGGPDERCRWDKTGEPVAALFWLFMRISGLVLVVLAIGHLIIMHLINSVEIIDYHWVAMRGSRRSGGPTISCCFGWRWSTG